MLERVLVPLDGSGTAEAVLPLVRTLKPVEVVVMRAAGRATDEEAHRYVAAQSRQLAGLKIRAIVREGSAPEAILAAARLHCGEATSVCAHVEGAGDGIAWRVRRLLSPEALPNTTAHHGALWIVRTSCTALLLGAVWLGITYGDTILDVVPGISP